MTEILFAELGKGSSLLDFVRVIVAGMGEDCSRKDGSSEGGSEELHIEDGRNGSR